MASTLQNLSLLERPKGTTHAQIKCERGKRGFVEIKDFEVKLAKMEAQMQASSQLYKHRTKDHLKQVKQEVDIMIKEADSPQAVMNEELLGLDEE